MPGEPEAMWVYESVGGGSRSFPVAAPIFEIDGQRVTAAITPAVHRERRLDNGVREHLFGGALRERPDLWLDFVVRIAEESPVVRFRYSIRGDGARLTKTSGADELTYLRLSTRDWTGLTEIRLAEFSPMVYSYGPAERPVSSTDCAQRRQLPGPLITAQSGDSSVLVGYEHGAQGVDSFLRYRVGTRNLELRAAKGNYQDRQPAIYETVWMQLAVVPGGADELASAYRRFLLKHHTEHPDSRRPYLFYNTWALQERSKWWDGGNYRDPMYDERILAEIEVARRIGIEVFVIDTGWYQRTGDWEIDESRFSQSLGLIKKRLDEYGMRLGLWFGPCDAAVSSRICQTHPEYQISWGGLRAEPKPVWETEESNRMCLVSPYGDYFANQLIRLAGEIGVSYFKWDAVGQYGCDDPYHSHGDASHTPTERADNYAFQLPLRLTQIADQICREVPGAIVDFDVTEPHRSVGLAFLGSGKYFLVNNGPYYSTYDVPDQPGRNPNLFFFPGQARARVCRAPLAYDRWIPSTLLLTHYLPDDPESSQLTNIASLILGQNGIWGDLTHISESGLARIAEIISHYKAVREDMASADPITSGTLGGAPEIHEKIRPANGRGAVSIFSSAAGSYEYITVRSPARGVWHTDGVQVTFDNHGRANIKADFDQPSAVIVTFS